MWGLCGPSRDHGDSLPVSGQCYSHKADTQRENEAGPSINQQRKQDSQGKSASCSSLLEPPQGGVLWESKFNSTSFSST